MAPSSPSCVRARTGAGLLDPGRREGKEACESGGGQRLSASRERIEMDAADEDGNSRKARLAAIRERAAAKGVAPGAAASAGVALPQQLIEIRSSPTPCRPACPLPALIRTRTLAPRCCLARHI